MNLSHDYMSHEGHTGHGSMDHGSMDHGSMNHSGMHHDAMGHENMNHGNVDHSAMGHDHAAHATMNHAVMSHANMNHSAHMQNGSGGCSSMGHHMSMFFHGGYCETVLFESWKISSVSGLVGSVIGIMIMATFYEGLKYYREYLFWKTYNSLQYRSVTMSQEKNVPTEDNRVVQPTMLSWMHSFQTFLHIMQVILSYFLMLIFMTYNVWLCFAVVLGAAIGYFLFGWKKSVIVDVTEHCH